MELATGAIDLLSKAATIGGGIWAAWGLVVLGTGIKDHNGPGIQGGIWQLVGGLLIVAAGALIADVQIDMDLGGATGGATGAAISSVQYALSIISSSLC